MTFSGSSPLTRGKPSANAAGALVTRLIPAHAGKTLGERSRRARHEAHPRSRGENIKTGLSENAHLGSSPLTRGKRGNPPCMMTESGLIPAHAGKTAAGGPYRGRPRAHPRSRGENGVCHCAFAFCVGSSPLTRGKLDSGLKHSLFKGLIPAHAGKTGDLLRRSDGPRAHPRSRGENSVGDAQAVEERGSSPLTRGKRRAASAWRLPSGLIPAHAGKTRRRDHSRRPARAHPRSRGENAQRPVREHTGRGSSPLTRGKPARPVVGASGWGLIPAHAGKTEPSRGHAETTAAHPRSRGENIARTRGVESPSGSSPLTRGKRIYRRPRTRTRRLIPAHAGKTSTERQRPFDKWAHPRSRGENALLHRR